MGNISIIILRKTDFLAEMACAFYLSMALLRCCCQMTYNNIQSIQEFLYLALGIHSLSAMLGLSS